MALSIENRSSICMDHSVQQYKCFTAAKLVGPGPTRPTPGYATTLHVYRLACNRFNDEEIKGVS